jgi:phosphoadenosine phosphosulfate reductase
MHSSEVAREALTFDQIADRIRAYRTQGKQLFATSAFQPYSAVLLHLISRIDRSIPIYYLDTGYLFPETLSYKDHLAGLFGIEVRALRSSVPRSLQKDVQGRLLFASDPDRCCHLNKVQPMDAVLTRYDVWINGIRRDQNANRSRLGVEERTPQGALRFHPLLDWSTRAMNGYMKEHDLPAHPLEDQGFTSVGCEPCTRLTDEAVDSDPRLARWFGLKKTECGLHTELVQK